MEITFPSQGPQSYYKDDDEDHVEQKCETRLGLCIPLRSLRSFGFFGLASEDLRWGSEKEERAKGSREINSYFL